MPGTHLQGRWRRFQLFILYPEAWSLLFIYRVWCNLISSFCSLDIYPHLHCNRSNGKGMIVHIDLIIISDGCADSWRHVLLLCLLLQGHIVSDEETDGAWKSHQSVLPFPGSHLHSARNRCALLPQQMARLHRLFLVDAVSLSFRRVNIISFRGL